MNSFSIFKFREGGYESGAVPYLPPLRFPGQYFDAETEFHENWNRYYDPQTGRYLSPEPLLQSPTWVRDEIADGHQALSYPYANDNPVGFIDIDGLRIRLASRSTSYRYNQAFSGTTPWSKHQFTTACTESCGSWKFDVDVHFNLVVQLEGDGSKQSVMDLKGTSLLDHEERHVNDFLEFFTEDHLNSSIMTEGFASKPMCEEGRRVFGQRLIDFMNHLSAYSTRMRDNYNRAE